MADYLPDTTAEQPREQMDEADAKAIAKRLIDDARGHMDDVPLPGVRKAWRYYHGEVDQSPMGYIGEVDGSPVYEGSKIVITECRDTVQMLIPELYRIFNSVDEVVRFTPSGPEDVKQTEQATQYCNFLFWSQEDSEKLVKDALLDWSIKYCAVRVWWEVEDRYKTYSAEGIDEQAMAILTGDESIVELDGQPYQETIYSQMPGPDGQPVSVPQQVTLYRVQLKRKEPRGKACIALIPHEELLLDGDAQKLEDCAILGTDCMRRASDLIAMGLDRDLVYQHVSKGSAKASRADQTRREREHRDGSGRAISLSAADRAMGWVRLVDAKVRIDRDGDGQAEDWRVWAIGDHAEIVRMEPDSGCDVVIVGSPYPTPHTIVGEGIVENGQDLQELSTFLVRGTLNNLARSLNPRPTVTGTLGGKGWEDLVSWFGGPVDLGKEGAVDWLTVPFVAGPAMQFMEYVEQRRSMRTGISPAAMGLDADALKGQTADSNRAIVTAPQARIDGFAREFASGVMRPIFKALLKLTAMYQDRPAVMRLRNEWVTVDPRGWNATMDATAEVGLGLGTKQERMASLLMVIAQQKELILAGSALADQMVLRNALGDLANAIGIKDTDRYFKQVTEEILAAQAKQAEAQRQKQMQEQIQVTAAIEQAKAAPKAQADVAKAQLDAQNEVGKAQLKAQTDLADTRATLQAALQKQADDHQRKMIELMAEMRLELVRLASGAAAGNGKLAEADGGVGVGQASAEERESVRRGEDRAMIRELKDIILDMRGTVGKTKAIKVLRGGDGEMVGADIEGGGRIGLVRDKGGEIIGTEVLQ